MMLSRTTLAVIVALSFVCCSVSAADVIGKAAQGDPQIASLNVLSFAPDGTLLVGDGRAAQIVAIDTSSPTDTKKTEWTGPVEKIQAKLAARLGTTSDGIEILDLAVHPVTSVAFLAVRKQDDKSFVLLTVDGAGTIRDFPLNDVRYARARLDVGDSRITLVTDVAWADDRIIAAGRSNEEFASKIFSVDAPLDHDASSAAYSSETYHVSHGRWETRAPMSVLIPFKENDQTYVIGAFSCTPIVKYPLDALQPGANVKGSSMIELGSGNRPLDMFVYQKDGKNYVLANTFRFHHDRRPFGPSPYWTVRFEQGLLAGDKRVNEDAVRRLKGNEPAASGIDTIEDYHGVMQMDQLDDRRALTLRQTDEGLSLGPQLLP